MTRLANLFVTSFIFNTKTLSKPALLPVALGDSLQQAFTLFIPLILLTILLALVAAVATEELVLNQVDPTTVAAPSYYGSPSIELPPTGSATPVTVTFQPVSNPASAGGSATPFRSGDGTVILDIGVTGPGRLLWAVVAVARPVPGALAGQYVGASVSATCVASSRVGTSTRPRGRFG